MVKKERKCIIPMQRKYFHVGGKENARKQFKDSEAGRAEKRQTKCVDKNENNGKKRQINSNKLLSPPKKMKE